MNARSLIWTVTAGALFTFSSQNVFAAGGVKLFTHASRGTIVSISVNELVLEHKKKGEVEVLHFVLTPDTARKGYVAAGALVSVHYRIENNQQVATSIQAQPSKPSKPTSK